MDVFFHKYKGLIEEAKTNQLDDSAKLIIWGILIDAMMSDRLTISEVRKLEELLDPELRDRHAEAYKKALHIFMKQEVGDLSDVDEDAVPEAVTIVYHKLDG